MPIQSGDVKLLKSAVMADVPEGGGAPTGNVVADGVSNSIFPDISELDRAGGRVSLRKTFAAIHTDDRDTYFGANVIVADPPEDPRVSVTLFSNKSTFDTRAEAQTRVEAYLNKGPEWAGYLYENHIAGQRVVQIFQRPTDVLPNVGQTLVLIQNEGEATEKLQYIRATAVSAVERTFTYNVDQDYKAMVVTIDLSDALRYDFTGSPASRTFTRTTNGTRVRDTVVADAGSYAGVVGLTEASSLGAFTVKTESIFTQLVPSAQTESPISDVRMNGLSAALVPTGGPVTQSLTLAFTTAQSMFVGGPIYPGSLSVVRSGVTVTDSGGLLVSGGTEVGTVDYDNGILSLTSNVFGTGAGTHTVTFVPAATPDLISDQRAILVTAESRSLSYAFVVEDKIAPRTMSISYLAQGRWYVLRDDGSGVLRGTDAAYGAGTINYSTGSVVVTLGALPDVGSSVVVQSYSEVATKVRSNTELVNGGKAYFAFNTDSVVGEEKGSKQVTPSGLVVNWNNGGAKTATDDGLGVISGDATGTVDYVNGVIRLSPNALPPAGTVFTANLSGKTDNVSSGVTLASGSLAATNIAPGSIQFTLPGAQLVYSNGNYFSGAGYSYPSPSSRTIDISITDDGAGNLQWVDAGGVKIAIGTVNYSTGAFTLTGFTTGGDSRYKAIAAADPEGPTVVTSGSNYEEGRTYKKSAWDTYGGYKARSLALNAAVAFNVNYASAGASTASTASATMNELRLRVPAVSNYALKGARFGLGGSAFAQLPDNTLTKDPSPTTGGGTPAGTVSAQLGLLTLSSWPVGASPVVIDWRGMLVPPTTGVEAPFGAPVTIFRTASAPLRPGSLSVLGGLQDGTTFNVTAGVDGKINGTRVKGRVDYEYGLVELYFVNASGDPLANVDLSHLGISGLTTIPADMGMLPTLRYNAVAYSYLPLDAELLGIDPVRLPSDGRVPIFRPGGFAVVGHTGEITAAVSNGQTINCARVRLSRVRVIGADGVVINTGFTADLEAGTVTFTNVSGYSQPVTVQHRIEDMAVVRQVQINGEVTFTRALTHAYPLGSYVSSALVAGDLFSRVSVVFDQETWSNAWSDSVSGSPATGTFNNTANPITVTNRGALTERWAVRFTNSTTFEVIGEHVGVIATGNTGTDCAPNNPTTGVPYFTIPSAGWGSGWSVGNVLRFNTIGAEFPVWVVRTVQQGPETVPDDAFTLLIRGDVNA